KIDPRQILSTWGRWKYYPKGTTNRALAYCSGSVNPRGRASQRPLNIGVLAPDSRNCHLPGARVVGHFAVDDGLAARIGLAADGELNVLRADSEAACGDNQPRASAGQRGIRVHARDVPEHPIFAVTTGVADKFGHRRRSVQWNDQRTVEARIFRCYQRCWRIGRRWLLLLSRRCVGIGRRRLLLLSRRRVGIGRRRLLLLSR